jgi:pantoate--beta-alanine ligase
MVRVIDTPRGLFDATQSERLAGHRIGLVPTMGALHDGHVSLVNALRAAGAQRLVLSIFVNPLQFGPNEDLAKYPRTFDADLARCEQSGVDIVYAPEPATMYPPGFETHVELTRVTRPFEGAARPAHFRGVSTVVTKLFNATGPCLAAFGQKDFQQLRVIQRLVIDLDMPVRVLACPIARERDGLAMSSRNRFLSGDERARSIAIFAGLSAANQAFKAGERDRARLSQLVRDPIAAAFDSIDYAEVVDADSLVARAPDGPVAETSVALVAARLGSTRLIDNCILGADLPATA